MDRIVAELNAELARVENYLAQGNTADLQARLERLEQTRDEVRLLRELDRIVATYGLTPRQNATGTIAGWRKTRRTELAGRPLIMMALAITCL